MAASIMSNAIVKFQLLLGAKLKWCFSNKKGSLEVCIAKFKNIRTYYCNEKQKLSSFRSGTGARDLVPKWEHFARLQFLDDTIKPLDSISNLNNMELEVNATSLNVSDEDLFENVVELPPIPDRAPSESELPQRIRVFTSTLL
ncbi:hypothetical protein TNCV_864841 [Trichonephila clavipes]|nr:hypothetical protein TNCV_864841 [Trichonephila clavipes]